MCGIAGAAWTAGATPLTTAELHRMTGVLSHRGPDADGFHESDAVALSPSAAGAALGHRRLSIIDLAGSAQPLCNEDQTVWIVFNGEIYNYRELRPALEAQGHRFRTSGDTETIVHLYEQYGERCVEHLRGMFAFAIWDETRQRLFLARDRMGQKPLYYREDAGRLLFASELKSLLQVDGAPRELNPQAVDDYLLYQYVPYPDCILRKYHKLPPGHTAIYEQGRLTVQPYWSAPDAEPLDERPPRTREEWSQQLRETLTEAVRLRMRSDVPFGAFLSGGVDSTIIAGLMQQLSNRPVQTFSIGFPVKSFDERAYAREAAQRLGTEHHEFLVEPHALEILPQLIWHYDEPFGDSSAIPTMYLSRVTRQRVTVALSGDGGDELFAGYDRYRAVRLGERFDRLPRIVRRLLTSRLWQQIPASVRQKSRRRRLKRLLSALGEQPERRYLQWIAIFDDQRRRDLYDDGFAQQLADHDAADFLLSAYAARPDRDFVTRTTYADVLTYLPCDILTKVDIASMSTGLECRSPFMDHRVVECAARMPVEFKLTRVGGKRILIDTFKDLLPESIQKRPKMGFGVPLDHWFRRELRDMLHDLLLDSRSLQRGLFRPDAIRRLLREHTEGQFDHSYRLWSMLVLELWQRTYLDPATAPTTPPASA